MKIKPISLHSNRHLNLPVSATRAGDWLFISGQLGANKYEGETHLVNFSKQTQNTFENIDSLLRAEGGELSNIVKLTAFLINPIDHIHYEGILFNVFKGFPPANTCISISALPDPKALIGIEAYAYLGSNIRPIRLNNASDNHGLVQGAIAGKTMWISGQRSNPEEGNGNLSDFSAQLTQVYKKIQGIADEGGIPPHNLVKFDYFITNPQYYWDLVNVRDQQFKNNPPGDDVITVRALSNSLSLVEAEAIALVPPGRPEFVDLTDLPTPFNFSNVVIADNFAYVSGQTALNTAGNFKGTGNFADQFNNALLKLKMALESIDCSFEHAVKISYFINHAGYFDQANSILKTILGPYTPAVTCCVVDSIGGFPEAMCEIDAVAAIT